jgi:hypothetical protein
MWRRVVEQNLTSILEEPVSSISRVEEFYLEDGGSKFLRNLVLFYHTTQRHIQEDSNVHTVVFAVRTKNIAWKIV